MRKMFFTIVALVAMAASAFAQTEEGKIYVGASSQLGFNSTKHEGADKSQSNFGLNVNGGYFIVDDISINAALGFNSSSYDKNSSNTISFGLGGRYYLPMKVFFGAMFDIASYGHSYDGDSADRVSGMGLTLGAGYAIFVNDNVSIEPFLGYRLGLSDKDKGTQYNQFGLSIGFGIYF